MTSRAQENLTVSDYYNYGLELLSVQPDSARYYFQLVDSMSAKKKDKHGQYLANNGLGQYYVETNKLDTALVYLQKSKIYCAEYYGNTHEEYANALSFLGRYYLIKEQEQQALHFFDSVVHLFQNVIEEKNTPTHADALRARSNILIKLNLTKGAILSATAATQIVKTIYGDSSTAYASSIFNLGVILDKAGRLSSAITNMEQAISILEKNKMQQHPFFTLVKNKIAMTYAGLGSWLPAKENYFYVEQMLKANGHVNTRDAAILKLNMGHLYLSTTEYKKAQQNLEECNRIYISLKMTNSAEYIELLNTQALLYDHLDDYDKASEFDRKAYDLALQLFGKQDQQTIIQLNNRSIHFNRIAQKDSALYYINYALQLAKKSFDPTHPTLAKIMINSGELYSQNSNYSKAESLFQSALDILDKAQLISTPDYAEALDQMARLYEMQDQYEKAYDFFNQSIRIKKNIYTVDHPSYAGSLHNIANLYVKTGQFGKAKKNYLEAIKVFKQVYGLSPTVATIQSNLAQLYLKSARYVDAKKHLIPALQITEKTLGKNHPNYALMLGNLAVIYAKQDSSSVAEKYALEAKEIAEKKFGPNHAQTAIQINNGAYTDLLNNYYDKAEAGFLKALHLIKKSYGTKHSTYGDIINNLMILYYKKNDIPSAVQYAKESSIQAKEMMQSQFGFATEEEKAAFVSILTPRQDIIQKIALQTKNSELLQLGLNNQLMLKGLVLSQSKNIIAELEELKTPKIQKLLTDYLQVKKQLVAEHQLPNIKKRKNKLQQECDALETQIVKIYSKNFAQAKLETDWNQIKDKIKQNEVAIEFASFADQGLRQNMDVTYIAYLIKKNADAPILIELGKEKEINQILKTSKTPNNIYALRGSIAQSTKSTNIPSQELFNFIWQPLAKYLNDIEKIYFSPSGLLNRIPLGVLPYKGKPLCSTFVLDQRSNLISLSKKVSDVPVTSFALFGDVDYNYSQGAVFQKTLVETYSKNWKLKTYWAPLPGTKKEINQLGEIIKSTNHKAIIYSQDSAGEHNFKQLNNHTTDVIHLATHGFFYNQSDSGGIIYSRSHNPMLRSGLIFNGGNRAWQNYSYKLKGENGILTALEISNMNLKDNKLVVLSACETALGDIQGSEGVYGLQRAFKMAGAEKIIMSLWKVPDAPTAKFMKLFYENWLSKNQRIQQAFRNTQLSMIGDNHPPLDWAGFVLVE